MPIPTPRKIRTFWSCEHCGAEGMIDHDRHAGAWEVIEAIAEAHRDAQQDYRICRHGVGDLRVYLGPVTPKKRKAK